MLIAESGQKVNMHINTKGEYMHINTRNRAKETVTPAYPAVRTRRRKKEIHHLRIYKRKYGSFNFLSSLHFGRHHLISSKQWIGVE
jgi:hypothetical protein